MAPYRILWISAQSDPQAGWNLAGWEVETRPPLQALESLAVTNYSAVVLSLPFPGWPATELLGEVTRLAAGVPILAYDPAASVEEAVTLAHLGVYQFLPDMESASRLIPEAIED